MSRTFWLVSQQGKRTVSPPIRVRQQFRKDAIEVVMFSVGEGEAILISRNSTFLLVDGGSVNTSSTDGPMSSCGSKIASDLLTN